MVSVRVRLDITDKTIGDIIMMSIPAMRFWCNTILHISTRSKPIRKTWGSPHEQDAAGKLLLNMDTNKIIICDKNTGEHCRLTRKKIIKGMQKFFANWTIEVGSIPHIDEEIAHKIMQYALFGHVRYDSHGMKIS